MTITLKLKPRRGNCIAIANACEAAIQALADMQAQATNEGREDFPKHLDIFNVDDSGDIVGSITVSNGGAR